MVREPARSGRSGWARIYARRMVFSDTLMLLSAYAGLHLIWVAYRGSQEQALAPVWVITSAVCILIWLASLALADTRDPRVLGSGPDEYKRIVTSTLFVFGFIALLAFAVDIHVPRVYVIVALPLGLALLAISRWTWRQWLILKRWKGELVDDVLVVGTARSVGHIIDTVHTHWHSGYRVIGACVGDAELGSWINGVPVVGGMEDAARLAAESNVAGVVVASSDQSHPEMMQELGWALYDLDVDLIVAPALTNIAGPRVHVRPVAGVPLLHVEPPTYRGSAYWQKTLLDRFGSLGLLILFSPVILLTALIVRLTSRGPVFYIQDRVGVGGTTFGMIKFRTMVEGADTMLADLAMERDAGNEMLFKMKNDPRVTRVGRVLRRYSLDELPQLFNVLVGDMSLVGPRPPLPSEVERYEALASRRLLVRPGVTGVWQVSGRSELDWEETIRLDLYYVENWSLVGDLLILARTLRAVLSPRGAY